MKALIRWILFICVGLPVQALVYVLYPFIWLYWRIAIYKTPGDKQVAYHQFVDPSVGKDRRVYNQLINNIDDHNAFSMYGALNRWGLELMVDDNGNPVRRVEDDHTFNQRQVSGDVVIAWAFAYTAQNMVEKPVEVMLQMAKTYLKNLGVQSFDEINNGHVSNRCNNFGVNWCPDSEAKGIGQPAGGPQFYTSSSIFALASQHSFYFKIVFWVHWMVMGGWYWAWWPVIYTEKYPLWYVKDMTMKALFVHKYVFGNRWWIRRPMETITYELSVYRNDLWYAMLGHDPIYPLPESMDSFFSQHADATSRLTDRMNGYLGPAVVMLADQARKIKA